MLKEIDFVLGRVASLAFLMTWGRNIRREKVPRQSNAPGRVVDGFRQEWERNFHIISAPTTTSYAQGLELITKKGLPSLNLEGAKVLNLWGDLLASEIMGGMDDKKK